MALFQKRKSDREKVVALHAELTLMRERLDASEKATTNLASHVELVDSRVTNVATELVNQVTELGHEIEGLPEPSTATPDDVLAQLDEVQTSQERLASEQVRYQIQFRRDLAEVADRTRRRAS